MNKIESRKLGTLTVKQTTPTSYELAVTLEWSGRSEELIVVANSIAKQAPDFDVAIAAVESRIQDVRGCLPGLRPWCLAQLRREAPWFFTERLLDTYGDGVAISSSPEEMVDLLNIRVVFNFDVATQQMIVHGWLACPPLDETNKLNCDVNCWLGNHDYQFVLNEENQLSDFVIDG